MEKTLHNKSSDLMTQLIFFVYQTTRGQQSHVLRVCVTLALSHGTWKLRAAVSTTQAPQQIPKPHKRSSFRPEASTMKT